MSATETYLGRSMLRVEDARLVTGRGQFLDDVVLAGMLHAAFVRSPHAHARVVSIDTSAARALDGVVAVYTHEDLDGIAPIATTIPTRPDDVKTSTRHLLVKDRARHVGDAVCMIVATSRYIAEDAAELVEVDWDPLPAVTDPESAIADGAPLVHDDQEGNVYARVVQSHGDIDAAFAKADVVVKKRFHFGRAHAAPLEGRGTVAQAEPGTGSVTIWTSSQVPHIVRTFIAPQLGIPENRVRVISPDVGGGFGLKLHVFVEDVLVVLAAQRTGRPVKWIEDRYESMVSSTHAKEIICDLELAVQKDGTFVAIRGRYLGDGGAYQPHPWTTLVDVLPAANFIAGIYRFEAVGYEAISANTNKCQAAAYRGVGWTPGHVAREALIDAAARELGIDPHELRLKNTLPEEPQTSVNGLELDGGSYRRAQELAAAKIDYAGFREKQAQARTEGRYLGIGVSPLLEQGAWAARIANAMGFPLYAYMDQVSISMEPDGSVSVTTGLHSQGQGHETTLAQLTADQLGVPIESVRIIQGDTAATAYSTGTYGSRTAVVGGGAIMRAAADLKEKLKQCAGALLEASGDDIEIEGGVARVKGSPDKSMPVPTVAFYTYWTSLRPQDIDCALIATRSYDPPETYSNAAMMAIVEVDVETGKVEIQRLVCAEDCGTVMNPMIVDGQLNGATAQGIGMALFEEQPYTDDGQPRATTLMDFLYPTATEIPRVEIHHLETPSPVTEGGFKGMAEGGNIAAPAAIVNAVQDALAPLGVEVAQTPLTPNVIRGLIRAAAG